MKLEIICIQNIDFVNDQNQRIQGTQLWWLDPVRNDERIIGRLPQKKWLTPEQVSRLNITGVGLYEVETDLRGRIIEVKKA